MGGGDDSDFEFSLSPNHDELRNLHERSSSQPPTPARLAPLSTAPSTPTGLTLPPHITKHPGSDEGVTLSNKAHVPALSSTAACSTFPPHPMGQSGSWVQQYPTAVGTQGGRSPSMTRHGEATGSLARPVPVYEHMQSSGVLSGVGSGSPSAPSASSSFTAEDPSLSYGAAASHPVQATRTGAGYSSYSHPLRPTGALGGGAASPASPGAAGAAGAATAGAVAGSWTGARAGGAEPNTPGRSSRAMPTLSQPSLATPMSRTPTTLATPEKLRTTKPDYHAWPVELLSQEVGRRRVKGSVVKFGPGVNDVEKRVSKATRQRLVHILT
ncbi:unnamed protein product, partial [Laminaria digitata]